MTYGNEQIGLELRDTFRGFPDEFMDIIVGSPQVRRFLCHLPRELAESAISARDKGRKALRSLFCSRVYIIRPPRVDHPSSVRISKSIYSRW